MSVTLLEWYFYRNHGMRSSQGRIDIKLAFSISLKIYRRRNVPVSDFKLSLSSSHEISRKQAIIYKRKQF